MARLLNNPQSDNSKYTLPNRGQGALRLRLPVFNRNLLILMASLSWGVGLYLVLVLLSPASVRAASPDCAPLSVSIQSNLLFRSGQLYRAGCSVALPRFETSLVQPGPLALAGPSGSSVQTSLKLSNNGVTGSTLDVSLAEITSGFTVLGLPITKLAARASASLGVSCQPGFSPATGRLVLSTSDPTQPSLTYQLSCSSAIPAFNAAPTPGSAVTLNHIGDTEANNSPTQEILVNNQGQPNSQLTVTLNSVSDGFVVTGLPATVSAGEGALSLRVQCQSDSLAATLHKGKIVLNTSDPSLPTVSYNLTCNLPAPVANINRNLDTPTVVATLAATGKNLTAAQSESNLAKLIPQLPALNLNQPETIQSLPPALTAQPATTTTNSVPAAPLLASQALQLSGTSASVMSSYLSGPVATNADFAGQLGWLSGQGSNLRLTSSALS